MATGEPTGIQLRHIPGMSGRGGKGPHEVAGEYYFVVDGVRELHD